VIVIILIYGRSTVFEHFKSIKKVGKSIKKGASSAKKVTKKAASSTGKTVAKVTSSASKTAKKVARSTSSASKVVSKAAASTSKVVEKSKSAIAISNAVVLNSFYATKNQVDDTDKMIRKTTKMANETNKLIKSLSKKIEQLNNRIIVANQKKIFSEYLNKKAAAKIAYLNTLVLIINTIGNIQTQKGMKQNEILRKKILTQLYAVKIYVGRANSYSCFTKNLFSQIESNYNDVIYTHTEIQNNIPKVNAMIENTKKSVVETNNKITNTNNQIAEANKPSVDSDVYVDLVTDVTDVTDVSDAFASESSNQLDASDESEVVDEAFTLEDVSQLDLLVFDIPLIILPSNIVIPPKQSIPTIRPNELITPPYTEPNISKLFPSAPAPAPTPTLTQAQIEINTLVEYQAESELEMLLPKEEFIPIPFNADPLDIQNENELIYELN